MRQGVLESQKIEFSIKLCTHCGNEELAERCPGRRVASPGPSLLVTPSLMFMMGAAGVLQAHLYELLTGLIEEKDLFQHLHLLITFKP